MTLGRRCGTVTGTAATFSHRAAAPRRGGYGFRTVARMERQKFRTVRSTWYIVAALAVSMIRLAMIEARGLVKHYRSTLAVNNLSFDVRPGTVTGFLGPNGAGKSTTMRMIMGLDQPDAGQVTIGGKRYSELRWPLREGTPPARQC